MTIALRVLAVHKEALWHDQMENFLCAGHGNVEQAALFLDLGRGAGSEPLGPGRKRAPAENLGGRGGGKQMDGARQGVTWCR